MQGEVCGLGQSAQTSNLTSRWPQPFKPHCLLTCDPASYTMAAVRRGQRPLNLEMPNPSANELPPISALFQIYFDIKAGYTIGWKRSLPGIELEGVVEYKSLPSGLHTVKEDLIYFVHDDHAGLSAFINAPAAEESRNARMIAVGIMVPLSYGRLGRSWKHAQNLKAMARCVALFWQIWRD